MALAKIGALDPLFRLFPKILTPPAVHHELITEGLRLGAPDAALLQDRYQSRELAIVVPPDARVSDPVCLGPGEKQSILLAAEVKATWLLMDDLDARRAAAASLAALRLKTRLKGTLGMILSAREGGHLAHEEAIHFVESLRQRPDIWISSDLCTRVLALLDGQPA